MVHLGQKLTDCIVLIFNSSTDAIALKPTNVKDADVEHFDGTSWSESNR